MLMQSEKCESEKCASSWRLCGILDSTARKRISKQAARTIGRNYITWESVEKRVIGAGSGESLSKSSQAAGLKLDYPRYYLLLRRFGMRGPWTDHVNSTVSRRLRIRPYPILAMNSSIHGDGITLNGQLQRGQKDSPNMARHSIARGTCRGGRHGHHDTNTHSLIPVQGKAGQGRADLKKI